MEVSFKAVTCSDRHLVLGVDVGGVGRIEASKLLLAHDRLFLDRPPWLARDDIFDVTTFLCQCSFILARTFLAMGLPLNASWGFRLVHVRCSIDYCLPRRYTCLWIHRALADENIAEQLRVVSSPWRARRRGLRSGPEGLRRSHEMVDRHR